VAQLVPDLQAATHEPPLLRDAVAWLALGLGTTWMALAAAPAMSWLDSGELVAAARELGNVHPPGHPAWLSLAASADLLPLGPYAARTAWLSALGAGVSLLLIVRIARLCVGGVDSGWWAAAAALAFCASGSLWQVGVRTEVYTVALAGNLWALCAALRATSAVQQTPHLARKNLTLLAQCAVAICLGLLNHHYVTLFVLPAVLVAGWPALIWLWRKQRLWLLFLAVGCIWLGFGYLALSLRSLADTEMRWGNPAIVHGLWDTLTARHFQKSVTEASAPLLDNGLVLLGMIAAGMGGWLAGLGATGLALATVRPNRTLLSLWLALLGGLGTKALMQIDTRNPDDHGYVLMAAAVLAIGVAQFGRVLVGADGIAVHKSTSWRRGVSAAALLLAAPLCAWQLVDNWHDPACNLARLRAPEAIDNQMRRTLAPGALYLSNYYGLAFNEQAFRIAEGRRPDVVAPHLTFRTGDTDHGHAYQAWFAKRHPELRRLAVAAQSLDRAPVGNALALAESQPVYAEQDPAARIPAPCFSFDGLAQRMTTLAERTLDYDVAAQRDRAERIWTELYARLGEGALLDQPTRALLLWQHALQAAHALRRGWLSVAQAELAHARRLNPHDRVLDHLDARLGALDAAWKRADTKAFRNLWQHYASLDFDALIAAD